MNMDKTIFRAYDIRGIVGEQINEQVFYRIGQAIACRLTALQRKDIVLARDGRLSSDALAFALEKGLIESGISVINLGVVATPIMYYATFETGVDSGLMVTGSHNPAEYNGIKMVLAGTTLAYEDVALLYQLAISQEILHGTGSSSHFDITEQYKMRILSDIQLVRPLKVVIDCGNGVGGPVIVDVIRRLGCQVIPLYCDVDGRFPNHHPDPTVESNLVDLKAAVQAHQADIGLAFDGDADRLGVLTEQGHIIWPDRLMMMYANHVLKANPGATIVYDVKCSSHLGKVIIEAGGIPNMSPTGHSIVKRIMKETKAALAGEMSGHLFFKDRWYGFDDALYSACRLLEIVSQSSQTVSQQFATIPDSVNTPEIKIPIFESEKFEFMQQFAEKASFPNAQLIDIDGLRVEFAEGWGLVRASNTTPCLVARFEADSHQALADIQARFKAQLHAVNAQLMIPF